MSPFQHGEVFVTDDGAETDLDLGHYERFTHAKLSRDNNWTTGRLYEQIIAKERRGDYLRQDSPGYPHVTNEIKAAMKKVAQDVDVAIVKSAEQWATSNRCRLWKLFAKCARSWDARTLYSYTSRWFVSLLLKSSKQNQHSTQ